jgi:cytochrome c oxidase subunit II
MKRAGGRLASVGAMLLLSACQLSNHNALAPRGPQAERVSTLFWVMLAVCGTVFLIVLAMGMVAMLRGRRAAAPADDPVTNARMRRAIVLATGATALILMGLMVADFRVGRATGSYSAAAKDALTIQVIGHQWWWEVIYEDSIASRSVETSNEIHIPVGRPILIKTQSRDVIHSFWIPNLAGKRDMIPGYDAMLWLRADRPGVYEGQCAEYCGHQHAKMRLTLIAETPENFSRWYESALRPARPPTDPVAQRGLEVFLAGPCVMCHAIRGTPAGGTVGPDLTHIASQRTIGAGSLPNNRGTLAAWITDAQAIKPGVVMPPVKLAPDDLAALVAYLGTLE